jgi:ubiquinone/menaquinone biosynthesis C-methylase UbiE
MVLRNHNLPAGNVFDKFASKNVLARRLVNNYLFAFDRHVGNLNPTNILEVGCGEGHIISHIVETMECNKISGIDISREIIRQASGNCTQGLFSCASAYNLPFQTNSFDLVICVEVLEHLFKPEAAMEEIGRVASDNILFSVPQEPIWRVVNVIRGAYLREWGNTPGHVQHWTKKEIVRLIEKRFRILEVTYPFPWTMVSCRIP